MSVPASFKDHRVCVVGLGYVGLTLAVAMADVGFSVLGIEVRDDVLEKLQSGEPHFHEPRLREKLQRVIESGNFKPSKQIDKSFGATVYILTVGTPLDKNGIIELRFMQRAAGQVAEALEDGGLVILRSTVKLGTARNVVEPILKATGKTFELAVCPERTLEGHALLELHSLPQIVGSDSSETRFRCGQIFSIMTPTIVSVSTLESAEFVKLVDNTFRDVTFGFANEVANLAGRMGVSAREIISAGKLGYPRTNVAWPGPVGGPCLEKDPHILSESAAQFGVSMPITKAARGTNESQPAAAVGMIASQSGHFPGDPKIALLGLAFKGVPATDDLRGTMAKPIFTQLAKHFTKARIVGYDSVVEKGVAQEFFGCEIADSIQDAFSGAHLVVIANNHPVFKTMDLPKLAGTMASGGIIYDFWNMFDDADRLLPADRIYMALGSELTGAGLPTPHVASPTTDYLLTGGTGFIGSALVRRLIGEGHKVRVIDNDLRGASRRLHDLKGRVELVACDVRDTALVTAAARGARSILHLAALNGTENFYHRPDLVLDVGVKGMLATLEAARVHRIEEFVLASSSEAYQTPPVVPTPEEVPLTIDDPWNVRYSYGGSKLVSEIMLGSYNRDIFKRAMIFRPHNVYGPDMGFEHVLPQFVMRAADAVAMQPTGTVPFQIQGDGRQTRSFIEIDDFIDGVLAILAKGQHRQIYHIGTEEERTINDVVDDVFNYFGREYNLLHLPLPAGGTLRRCPSIAKLRQLGFEPKTSFEVGLRKLADWYVTNRDLWPRKEVGAAA